MTMLSASAVWERETSLNGLTVDPVLHAPTCTLMPLALVLKSDSLPL